MDYSMNYRNRQIKESTGIISHDLRGIRQCILTFANGCSVAGEEEKEFFKRQQSDCD